MNQARRMALNRLARNLLGLAAVPLVGNLKPVPCKKAGGGPMAGYLPDVVVIDQHYQKSLFYSDLIRGKAVMVNFFFTRCTERCPLYTAKLVRVQQLLGAKVGRDVFMYSITLDPEHDRPASLRKYAEQFKVGPGWRFLTGKPDDIELLRRKLGFYDSDPRIDRDKESHMGILRFGYEPLARWGACPLLDKPQEIVDYVSWVIPERKPSRGETAGHPPASAHLKQST